MANTYRLQKFQYEITSVSISQKLITIQARNKIPYLKGEICLFHSFRSAKREPRRCREHLWRLDTILIKTTVSRQVTSSRLYLLPHPWIINGTETPSHCYRWNCAQRLCTCIHLLKDTHRHGNKNATDIREFMYFFTHRKGFSVENFWISVTFLRKYISHIFHMCITLDRG